MCICYEIQDKIVEFTESKSSGVAETCEEISSKIDEIESKMQEISQQLMSIQIFLENNNGNTLILVRIKCFQYFS